MGGLLLFLSGAAFDLGAGSRLEQGRAFRRLHGSARNLRSDGTGDRQADRSRARRPGVCRKRASCRLPACTACRGHRPLAVLSRLDRSRCRDGGLALRGLLCRGHPIIGRCRTQGDHVDRPHRRLCRNSRLSKRASALCLARMAGSRSGFFGKRGRDRGAAHPFCLQCRRTSPAECCTRSEPRPSPGARRDRRSRLLAPRPAIRRCCRQSRRASHPSPADPCRTRRRRRDPPCWQRR